MKKIMLLLIIVIFFGVPSFAQNKKYTDQKLKDIARQIIIKAKYSTLITLDYEGLPRARVMDAFTPEKDFTIWFGTNPRSRKVQQIRKNPNVTLFYFDKENPGYVTIQGIAKIINKKDEKSKRWKEEWNQFYKDRNDDYTLIKVSPKWMELISTKDKVLGDSITWQPTKIYFDK